MSFVELIRHIHSEFDATWLSGWSKFQGLRIDCTWTPLWDTGVGMQTEGTIEPSVNNSFPTQSSKKLQFEAVDLSSRLIGL